MSPIKVPWGHFPLLLMTDVFDLEDNDEPISQRDARTGVAEQRPRSVKKYAGLFYFTKVLIIISKLQTAHQTYY